MLSAMKKGTTVEQNERAIRWTKEVGISVAISVVVGYPGETADMLKQSFDFIRKTGSDYVYVRQAIPYLGIELFDLLRELGWRFPPTGIATTNNHRSSKTPFYYLKKLMKCVETFTTAFFPAYFLRKSIRRDFYSQIMARAALNHLLWRIKLPRWVSSNFRRLAPQKRGQWETQNTQQTRRHQD
jgi:radical SAM superfamily enzyme YgiQ (UPF0313 family)